MYSSISFISVSLILKVLWDYTNYLLTKTSLFSSKILLENRRWQVLVVDACETVQCSCRDVLRLGDGRIPNKCWVGCQQTFSCAVSGKIYCTGDLICAQIMKFSQLCDLGIFFSSDNSCVMSFSSGGPWQKHSEHPEKLAFIRIRRNRRAQSALSSVVGGGDEWSEQLVWTEESRIV